MSNARDLNNLTWMLRHKCRRNQNVLNRAASRAAGVDKTCLSTLEFSHSNPVFCHSIVGGPIAPKHTWVVIYITSWRPGVKWASMKAEGWVQP